MMADEEAVRKAEDRRAWQHSPGRRRSSIVQLVTGLVGFAVFLAIFLLFSPFEVLPKPTIGQLIGSVVGIAYFTTITLIGRTYSKVQRRTFEDIRLLERQQSLSEDQAKLAGERELKLGELWRLTTQRLSLYHQIATRQAQASFRNAQYAITGGFAVIIAGSAAAFLAKDATISVVVAVLSATGAALSAYIAKTFLRIQENAAIHLRSYFDQPQEQFKYLAAERLIMLVENKERKDSAIDQLIQSMTSDGRRT